MPSNTQSIFLLDDAHTFGGAQIALAHAVRALLENTALEVTLVTTAKTFASLQEILGTDLRLRRIECAPALPLNLFSFPLRLRFYWKLLGPLVRQNPNAHWVLNLSGIEFCLAALVTLRMKGVEPAAWLHNPERLSVFNEGCSRARRLISRLRDLAADTFVFDRYRLIMTPSEVTAIDVQSRARGGSRLVVHALYPTITGLSPAELAPVAHEPASAGVSLWMIGRIDYGHKNNALALTTLQEALRQGDAATLTVVGDGPDCARFLEEAERMQLGERVCFRGWQKDPWSSLPPQAVVMIPSRWEGNCLVAIEALLRGVKFVLSPIPAFTHVYPSGTVAKSCSPEAFCAAIRAVSSLSHDQLMALYAPYVQLFTPLTFSENLFGLIFSNTRTAR